MTIFEKAWISPGPWRIGSLESYHEDTGIPFCCVYRDDTETSDTRIVVNGGEGENGAHYDCDADAQLIAAAPEMLEALEIILLCGGPEKVSLYDEEGVEGWIWYHPDGREWTETGLWDALPPVHPIVETVIEKATGLKREDIS